jgi:arylsulfatase A-like enzyme
MRSILSLILILIASVVTAADQPPNVVLIVSDDHAWTDYGFMGHPTIQTPHLDRLASESLCFRRGYVTSSLCCPSLASIITGLYPHQHKVTSNDPPIPEGMAGKEFQASDAFREGREAMNRHIEAVATLPRELQKQGYRSLQTGKWWQGDFRRGGFTHGMTTGKRHGDAGLDIGRKTMKPIDDFIAESVEQKSPFFVWYAPMMPHDPHTPPERLLAKYRDKTPSIHVARYWAMVEWFDETCGELLKILDDRGVASNTVVIYVADNGWIQNPDKGGFLPSKRSPYDSGLRTPILVRWPGKATPMSIDAPVQSIDIAPTVLKLAGLEKTLGMQGIDLLDEAAVQSRKSVQGACYTHNAVDLNRPAANLMERWIVHDGWKLIAPTKLSDLSEPALYRISDDSKEEQEVSGDNPDVVQTLRTRLDGWWDPSGVDAR